MSLMPRRPEHAIVLCTHSTLTIMPYVFTEVSGPCAGTYVKVAVATPGYLGGSMCVYTRYGCDSGTTLAGRGASEQSLVSSVFGLCKDGE